MKIIFQKPSQALNKAYFKQNLKKEDVELFQKNLLRMFDRLDKSESEENHKSLIADFLKDTFYKDRHEINTRDRKDLVIHRGKTNREPVGVIIEAKKEKSPEMISENRPNAKALHELLLYYFDEREKQNIEISHLIITDLHNWFVFDENCFCFLYCRSN